MYTPDDVIRAHAAAVAGNPDELIRQFDAATRTVRAHRVFGIPLPEAMRRIQADPLKRAAFERGQERTQRELAAAGVRSTAHTIDFGLLTPMQRAALKRDNPQAYDASRKAWCEANGFPLELERTVRAGNRVMSRTGDTQQSAERFDAGGRRFEQLRPVERAALARSDRAAYDRRRADWIARGEPSE